MKSIVFFAIPACILLTFYTLFNMPYQIVAFTFLPGTSDEVQCTLRDDFVELKYTCTKNGEYYIDDISAGANQSVEGFCNGLEVS